MLFYKTGSLGHTVLMKTFYSMLISSLFLWSCASGKPNTSEKSQSVLECEPAGCSGQICAEKGKGVISNCLMLPQYECFRLSRCEIQSNGKCGWTPNREFQACLKRYQPAQTQ